MYDTTIAAKLLGQLKGRSGRWRGFDPSEDEKEREASLFAFFGFNTG